MDAGSSAKGIIPDHGIVDGDAHTGGSRPRSGNERQLGQVVPMRAQETQVDQQQIHLRIADPLTDPERGAVHPVNASFDGGQTVGHAEPPIAVAVPVDFDLLARRRKSSPP